jgi:SAM-dependent methyltransferase
MLDTNAYIQKLSSADSLREPAIRGAIQALNLPPGSRGLDAGCGIGRHTLWLAEAISPGGHVSGVDMSPEFIAYAEQLSQVSHFSEYVTFEVADVNHLPFDDNTFDWAWSVDCICPKPEKKGVSAEEPLPALKELARVVKPGGVIALLYWSSQALLPGYPHLEARLNATPAGIAPFVQGMPPELHAARALGWFRVAGLKERTAQTFVADVHAPLSEDARKALLDLFEMRWPGAQVGVTQEEWGTYQRLCRPESPDFLLDQPDYYAFFTYSMFCGQVARE